MPRIGDITETRIEKINLPSLPWFQEVVGLRKGGVYLLAGEPGIGKTTLAVQVLGDVSNQGMKCLYLTNEQTQFDLLSVAKRVLAVDNVLPSQIKNNFIIEHLVRIEDLEFWREHLFLPHQPYSNTSILVIDSVQGGGTTPTARASYKKLYSFTYAAKNHGITTILIGHVTKDGKIAGPKDLQHEVDGIIHIKKAFKLRPLFVPKNRYGPARMDPFVLIMNEKGKLIPSPHAAPLNAVVYGIGYDPELGAGTLIEVQASVILPKYGDKPRLRAPYLPDKKIKQLLDVLSQLPDIDVSNLTFDINCYVRGGRSYHFGLDLPLAVGIISSYLRVDPPKNALFIGEIDLNGRIRAPPVRVIEWLGQMFQNDDEQIRYIPSKLYISSEVGQVLEDTFNQSGVSIEIHRIDNLIELFKHLWPESIL